MADEGVDREIVFALRNAGHQTFYVAEMGPGTSDEEVLDEEVLNQSGNLNAVLVTQDKHFGE